MSVPDVRDPRILRSLREVARRADNGNEWDWRPSRREGSGGYPQQVLRIGDVVLVAECYEAPDYPVRFAEFIATFDPPTILALLDELSDRRAADDPDEPPSRGRGAR